MAGFGLPTPPIKALSSTVILPVFPVTARVKPSSLKLNLSPTATVWLALSPSRSVATAVKRTAPAARVNTSSWSAGVVPSVK